MKKLMVLAVVIAFLALPMAFAEESGGADYNSPNGHADGLADFLNNQDCIDHTHQIPERDNPVGVGVDLTVYQNNAETVAVVIEEKYDTQNEENSVFAVCQVNLWKMFKKEK